MSLKISGSSFHLLYSLVLGFTFQGISLRYPPYLLADPSISFPVSAAFHLTFSGLPSNLLILQLCLICALFCPVSPSFPWLYFSPKELLHVSLKSLSTLTDPFIMVFVHSLISLILWNTPILLFLSDYSTLSSFDRVHSISFLDCPLWFIFLGAWFIILIVSSSSVMLFFFFLWESHDPWIVRVSL